MMRALWSWLFGGACFLVLCAVALVACVLSGVSVPQWTTFALWAVACAWMCGSLLALAVAWRVK